MADDNVEETRRKNERKPMHYYIVEAVPATLVGSNAARLRRRGPSRFIGTRILRGNFTMLFRLREAPLTVRGDGKSPRNVLSKSCY